MSLGLRARTATGGASAFVGALSLVVVAWGLASQRPWPEVCARLDGLLFLLGAAAFVGGLFLAKPAPPKAPRGPASTEADGPSPEADVEAEPANPLEAEPAADVAAETAAAAEAEAWSAWRGRSLELVIAGTLMLGSTQALYWLRVPLGKLYGWTPPGGI